MFAHEDSRAAFQRETDLLAASAADGGGDAVVSLRRLLSEEPLAILFCADGSFVKASPSIFKTTNGTIDASASQMGASSLTMMELLQNAYKKHLASIIDDDAKFKNFGAAEVRSNLGACVGGCLASCFVNVCSGFGARRADLRRHAVVFQLERYG